MEFTLKEILKLEKDLQDCFEFSDKKGKLCKPTSVFLISQKWITSVQ